MKPIFPHDRSPICSEVSAFAGMKQGFGSRDLSVTTPSIGSQTFMRLPCVAGPVPCRDGPQDAPHLGTALPTRPPRNPARARACSRWRCAWGCRAMTSCSTSFAARPGTTHRSGRNSLAKQTGWWGAWRLSGDRRHDPAEEGHSVGRRCARGSREDCGQLGK
jgi:hypothetical protein